MFVEQLGTRVFWQCKAPKADLLHQERRGKKDQGAAEAHQLWEVDLCDGPNAALSRRSGIEDLEGQEGLVFLKREARRLVLDPVFYAEAICWHQKHTVRCGADRCVDR